VYAGHGTIRVPGSSSRPVADRRGVGAFTRCHASFSSESVSSSHSTATASQGGAHSRQFGHPARACAPPSQKPDAPRTTAFGAPRVTDAFSPWTPDTTLAPGLPRGNRGSCCSTMMLSRPKTSRPAKEPAPAPGAGSRRKITADRGRHVCDCVPNSSHDQAEPVLIPQRNVVRAARCV